MMTTLDTEFDEYLTMVYPEGKPEQGTERWIMLRTVFFAGASSAIALDPEEVKVALQEHLDELSTKYKGRSIRL